MVRIYFCVQAKIHSEIVGAITHRDLINYVLRAGDDTAKAVDATVHSMCTV